MTKSTEPSATPVVIVSKKRGLSAVWIAPVLAAIAVGYLLYDGISNRGPRITVTFLNAEGVVAGKTPIKFEGVHIGTVESVTAELSTGTVTVRGRLDASAHGFATEGSQFWIQYPRLGLDNLGDLDTLISGPYIACLPGDGISTLKFEGLNQRPRAPSTRAGLRIVLRAREIGSLQIGSRVYFRGIAVGVVDEIKLSGAENPVSINIFIADKYRELVRSNSYFWEKSGFHASFGVGKGLKISTKSIKSILNGGVGFHTPPGDAVLSPVDDGATFALHHHPDIEMKSATPISITFPDGRGLLPGQTEVRHDGLKIGLVTGVEFTEEFDGVRASILLNSSGRQVAVGGSSFWIARPEIGLGGVRGLDLLLNGVYIDSMPGDGKPVSEFNGLSARPGGNPLGPGLNVILRSDKLGSLRPGAPVYFREIVVGEILGVALADDSSYVSINAHIEPRYAPLIHTHTVFWNASGIQVTGGLSGIKVKAESLESILAGGVAFATPGPSEMGEQIQSGAYFPLHAEPKRSWLDWRTMIQLDPAGP